MRTEETSSCTRRCLVGPSALALHAFVGPVGCAPSLPFGVQTVHPKNAPKH